MAQPYPYQYPYPHGQPMPPPKKPFSTVDLVLTPLLSGLLLFGSFVGFSFSLFAGMATDACGGTPDRCNDGLIGGAYVVAWGGIGLAVTVTITGISFAAVKRKPMFIWPIVGLVVLVAGMVAGGFMLNAGTGG
jgi:hypothetical protein